MKVAGLALLAALASLMHGCAGTAASAERLGPADASQPWGRDPFTLTHTILVDGGQTGYLVEYQPTPVAVDVQRSLPTGSYRILDLHFEDVGFISPRGETWRHGAHGPLSLGNWSLKEGLARFFDRPDGHVKLIALAPTPQSAPATALAPAPDQGEAAPTDGSAAASEASGN